MQTTSLQLPKKSKQGERSIIAMSAEQSEKEFLLRRLPSVSLRRGIFIRAALRTSRGLLYIEKQSRLFHSLPISKHTPNKKSKKNPASKLKRGFR
jgi:hypothetical protein